MTPWSLAFPPLGRESTPWNGSRLRGGPAHRGLATLQPLSGWLQGLRLGEGSPELAGTLETKGTIQRTEQLRGGGLRRLTLPQPDPRTDPSPGLVSQGPQAV